MDNQVMQQDTHLLFICYDFPPNRDIGGRRTAKFAKAIAAKGYTVHVLKADTIEGQKLTSLWSSDVESPNIKVYTLPRNYPQIISHPRKGFFNSLKYRYHHRSLLKSNKGTIYDHALNWEESMKLKANELIDKFNIKNVFISGPPFNLFYYGAKLKSERKELNLILDYRDPWITAVNFGMQALSPDRMQFEKEKQQFIFETVDYIVTTEIPLLEEIKDTCLDRSKIKAKFSTITHFFDEDELLEKPKKTAQKKVNLVYGGNLYRLLEEHFKNFKDYLTTLRSNEPDLYNALNLEIYTQERQFDNYFDEHKSVVQINGLIGNKEIKQKLADSSGTLILLAQNNRHFRTTKFFEALPFEIPIIFIGTKGNVSEFIVENNLGFVINNFGKDFTNALRTIQAGQFDRGDFDYKKYSLTNISEQLEKLFVV